MENNKLGLKYTGLTSDLNIYSTDIFIRVTTQPVSVPRLNPPERLPGWKSLYYLVRPGGNVEQLIFTGDFLNFTLNECQYYLDGVNSRWWCYYYLDSPWCLLESHQYHSNPWWLFPRNIVLNFLDMIDCFSFVFTNYLWWAWNHFLNHFD